MIASYKLQMPLIKLVPNALSESNVALNFYHSHLDYDTINIKQYIEQHIDVISEIRRIWFMAFKKNAKENINSYEHVKELLTRGLNRQSMNPCAWHVRKKEYRFHNPQLDDMYMVYGFNHFSKVDLGYSEI